jgi:intein/homing endonuclease
MNFERKKLDGCCQIRISNKPLSDYLKNIIEKQNCYQKIIPNNILFSSESTRRKVLEGMIDSDGSRKRTKEDLLRNRKPTSYTTSSEKLKKCFCLLLRSLNIQYTVSERNPSTGGVVNGRQIVGSNKSWQILFSGNSLYGINDGCKGNRKRTKFNCIEKKILKIEKEVAYDGYVYDLEMDGHPSFVANGVLVHNSASPWRDDGADLFIDSQFGKRIVDISASFLIKNKWLVKPYITFIKIFTPPDAFSNYATIYKNHIVNSVQRNNCIADLALHHASKNQTVLILVRQIKHGKILESMIKDSIFISGVVNTKKRKEILDELRENKRKIVIASSLFDEGIDVRRLHCLIMASSGKSSTRALQRIGRVLRPFEDKTEAIIYDFMDSAKYLNAHAKARRKIYKTEDEFEMREIKIEDIVNEIRGNIWEPVRF